MRALVVGTAGHIDHGKSALVEALTGTHPDRLKEERERGITIDLGFAHVVHAGVALSFVDVPGHERFVRNMLAGAAGIDAVVLIVAADAGVQPQTREHFEICRLLGVRRGVIALTKSDLADADMRALAALDVRDLVRGSFLEDAPIVEVSAKTREGLQQLADALVALAGAASAPVRRLVRLPIDRVFTRKGFGTVVTGTLGSGAIAVNDVLAVLPGDRRVRVRGLHVHGGAVDVVSATSRAAVNLAGVGTSEVRRGDVLATPDSLHAATRLDVLLTVLPNRTLKHGARLRVHQGTGEAIGVVSLTATRERSEDDWTPARPGEVGIAAAGGGQALARLRLRAPLVARRGDRIILRAPLPAGTVAGGIVLDPDPPATGIRRPATVARLRRLIADPVALDVWLDVAGSQGVDDVTLIRRGGLDSDEIREAIERAAGAVIQAGDRYFAPSAAAGVERGILAFVAAHHRASPADEGPLRESVRAHASLRAAAVLVDHVLGALRTRGLLRGDERVMLPSHTPPAVDADRESSDAILARLREAGLTPPDVAALAASAGVPLPVAERVLMRLGREHRVARLDGIWFHADVLAELRRDVQGMRGSAATPATIDVATFKSRFGVSRKFAIPLLEWLDRERVTRRVGDRRVVIQPAG